MLHRGGCTTLSFCPIPVFASLVLACAISTSCDHDASTPRPAHAQTSENAFDASASSPVALGPARDAIREGTTLTFGVYKTDKASVMYNQFKPITDALSRALTARLARPVNVKLVILPTYAEGLTAIVNGDVDLARLGPASYVMAHGSAPHNPRLQLLAMELVKGKKVFQGVIVVRADSPIRSLGDLRGKRFAFGNPNSTIGCFLAKAELVKAQVFQSDLADSDYLGRHDKVAKAVEIGDFDAGSLKSNTYKKLNKSGNLRVLKSFDNVTKPWVAREGLPTEIVEALTQALLEFQDASALKALKASGFATAVDDDYALVREGMIQARAFDGMGSK